MGIILRQNKGSELTFAEVDGNFQSLYYSSSLSGNILSFFFPSSSVTHSVDIGGAQAGVNQIIAGSNVTISPADGKGVVTINSSGGGGGGSGIFVQTGSFYATTNDLQITGSLGINGDISLPDNTFIRLGDKAGGGGGDLKIYHDSSNSYIEDQGQGFLFLRAANSLVLEDNLGGNYFRGTKGGVAADSLSGVVQLYFSGSEKFRTTGSGVFVTGNVSASGNLFATVTDNTDTNFKTVMYDSTTGQFFSTGSYGSSTTYDYLAVGTIPSGVVNSPPMGTGYSSALGVATTGGSGTGMTVDTVVEGGGVLTVTINNPGTGYVIGDNNIVISGGNGAAIITLSGTISETNPSLRLIDNTFTFDDVKLTGGTNVTITRTSDTGITFDVAAASTDGIFNVVTGTIFGTTSSLQVTGSTIQQSPFTTTGANITASNAGTGGGVDKYAMTISESMWHYTDNVGVPTSKAWKTDLDGSYFNNFDHNTDTAEIVRFMAGLLSASAPDAAPNTRTYASLGVATSNTDTGTAPSGRVPQSSTNDVINYLNSKGFATPGATIFSGISPIYNNTSFKKEYSSVAGGSTIVSSSADTQLFGLGNIGQAFNVSGSDQYIFYDNSAKSPVTAISTSIHLLSKTGPGTANGLTIGNIETGNALIPDAYQDGKFAGVFDQLLYNGGVGLSNVTSSGYYYFSSSVAVQSGSSDYSDFFAQNEEIFYAPTTAINSGISTNTPTIGYFGSQSLTVTSRSLSGANYLLTATWESSASITNAFNPMFASSTTFARIFESNGILVINNGTGGVDLGSTNGGSVQTSNFIYDSTGVDARTIGIVPTENDIVKLAGDLVVNAGTTGTTNIGQATITPTTFTTEDRCRRRNGVDINTNTNTYEFFKPGTFGALTASGSMAYYGRAQGYDGSALVGTTTWTENFSGEDNRIKINNNLLVGTYAGGDKFTTSTYDEYILDPLELQVKPGYLVEAGGSYGYWSPANASSGDYIYYARAFQRNLNTGAGSVTMSLGTTLQAWNSTSNGVSAAIIFKSSGTGTYTPPRFFDPTNTVDNVIIASQAADGFINPFTSNIALYGNVGGSISGNNYNIPMRNGDGMVLDSSDQDFIVIIRYKNDPTPITSINITIA